MTEYNIRVRLFKAQDELHTCLVYMQEHRAVLADFGIEMITSNNNWVNNPGMYVIVAESLDTGDMMAGIRVQLVNPGYQLPIEAATGEMDAKIFSLVQEYDEKGTTGEVCGLWNSRKYKGIGISKLLIACSTAILKQLNVTSLFGLCDTSNTTVMRDYGGYRIETSVGENGSFYYPKFDLLAYAIIVDDPFIVSLAREDVRELIFKLRENPRHKDKIENEKSKSNLHYELVEIK